MPESLSVADWQARYGGGAPDSMSVTDWQQKYGQATQAPQPPPGRTQSERGGPDLQGLLDSLLSPVESLKGAGKRVLEMGYYASPANMMGNPMPEAFKPQGDIQQGGANAADIMAFLTPGGPETGLAGAGAQGLKMAAIAAAQGGDPLTAGAMGAAGPLAGKVLEGAGGFLKGRAVKQYGQALNATTGPLKSEAERIIPQLLEQRVTGTLKQLETKGKLGRQAAGAEIGATLNDATAQGRVALTKPIDEALEQMKAPFMAKNAAGAAFPANPVAVSSIEDIQTLVRKFGDTAPPAELHKVLRSLDDIVNKSNGFTRELPRGTAADITRQARSAFRQELNKVDPNLESLNSTFALWKGLQKVAGSTLKRKVGQSEIVDLALRAGIGGGAGALFGDDWKTQGAIGSLLAVVTRSAKYRTVSAVQKARIADALATGSGKTALSALSRLAASFYGGAPETFDQSASPSSQ